MLRGTLRLALALVAIGSLGAGARADELKATEKPNPRLPDEFKRKHPQGTFYGAYKVCVTPDGKVDSVETLRSIPDADDAIADEIRTSWKYEPPKTRTCTIEKFSFVMRKENVPPSMPPKPGAAPKPKKKTTSN